MFQIRRLDPAIEDPVKGKLITDVNCSWEGFVDGVVIQHPGARVIILYLDENVSFEVGGARILNLRLIPIGNRERWLVSHALFVGIDLDILVVGRSVAVDVSIAPETELCQPGPVQPAFSIGVQGDVVVSIDEAAGV